MKALLRRKSLFILCLAVVFLVRIGLYATTMRRLRGFLVRDVEGDPDNPVRLKIIMHNVESAAHFVPRATCMTQAISGQAIASWFGIPTSLHLGARQEKDASVLFHAWLVWRDAVVLGGDDTSVTSFASLGQFGPARE